MIYDLPFGRGRRFGAGIPGWADAALGGWSVSAISAFFSGSPFTPQTSIDACGCGLQEGSKRPDRIRDGNLPVDQRTIERWFDVGAFAVPAPGTLGNSGRNILISPGTKSVDLSLMKTFNVREAARVQFRAEFFNFPNHPNFGLPNVNIQTVAGGQVTSAEPGRQIQFGLKVQF